MKNIACNLIDDLVEYAVKEELIDPMDRTFYCNRLMEELNVSAFEPDADVTVELPLEEDYDTLGGLIFSQFTIIPEDGAQPELECHGLHIVVEKIEEHRVEKVLVTKLPEEKETEEEETD